MPVIGCSRFIGGIRDCAVLTCGVFLFSSIGLAARSEFKKFDRNHDGVYESALIQNSSFYITIVDSNADQVIDLSEVNVGGFSIRLEQPEGRRFKVLELSDSRSGQKLSYTFVKFDSSYVLSSL